MRIAVLCIGNDLLMDEGVGPSCARYLCARYRFPENVDVIDRAVMGMAIISDLRTHDFALVLDAVEVPDAEPGRLFSFDPTDVACTPAGMTSLHEVRFADVLGSAELLGIRCDGHCLGIQVENMNPSEFVVALTPRVAAAMPLLAQTAVRYLRRELGLEVVDLLAESDSARAGTGLPGSRDFSAAGARPGEAGDRGEAAAAVCQALPEVYGEPDATVMTRYLFEGLVAVGACPARDEEANNCVRFELPASPAADALAERFGVACVGEAYEPTLRKIYEARVSASITDYDCDALIGACLELVEAAQASTEG